MPASYYFFLEFATRCEYKAVLTFTICFEYLQHVGNILKRVSNISNAFETFETCFEYSQRVLNILQRVLNSCKRV